MNNILAMFRGDHLQALGLSLLLAFISTAICLLLAFPMAMVLRESKYGKQGFLIFVIILPIEAVVQVEIVVCRLRNGVIYVRLRNRQPADGIGIDRAELCKIIGLVCVLCAVRRGLHIGF